ncbi:MAG: VOC family protein [Actinomycetota bacterium]
MPTFDAIGLIAQDLPATLAFYRLLGLDIPADADGEPHVEVELTGGFRLMFDPVSTIERFSTYEAPAGGRNHALAFRCATPAEVDETFAAVVAAGHGVKAEPFDAFWGQRYATVIDPDGTPVDLYASLG